MWQLWSISVIIFFIIVVVLPTELREPILDLLKSAPLLIIWSLLDFTSAAFEELCNELFPSLLPSPSEVSLGQSAALRSKFAGLYIAT